MGRLLLVGPTLILLSSHRGLYMGDILLLCTSANQVRMFQWVLPFLEGLPVRFVSFDQWNPGRFHSADVMREAGLDWEAFPHANPARDQHWLLHPLTFQTTVRRLVGEWLDERRPALLVTGNDASHCMAALMRAANRRRIPSLLVQDGIKLPWTPHKLGRRQRLKYSLFRLAFDLDIDVGRSGLLGFGLMGTTRLALMSDWFRDHLVAHGVDPQRIVMAGYPPYDGYLARRATTPTERPDLPFAGDYLLYLHQPLQLELDLYVQTFRALRDAAARSGTALVVKLHPAEPEPSWWEERVPADLSDVVFLRDAPLEALIAHCRAGVVIHSTTALEVLMAGKPLGVLQYFPQPYVLELGSAAMHVPELGQVGAMIHGLLTDEPARQAMVAVAPAVIEGETHSTDGKASQRVGELIRDMHAHPERYPVLG